MSDLLLEYYDSSQDYRWEVVRASLDTRQFLIRYDPLDSFDSSRRTQHRMVSLPPTFMTESNLIDAIEAQAMGVIYKWNQGLEQDSELGLRSFQRLKGVSRWKATTFDSSTYYIRDETNPLRNKVSHIIDSSDPNQNVIRYVASPYSDSDRTSIRESLTVPMNQLWFTLDREDRLDSALDLVGLDSFGSLSADEITLLRGMTMEFGDSLSNNLQNNLYGFNDSDWGQWMFDANQVQDSYGA